MKRKTVIYILILCFFSIFIVIAICRDYILPKSFMKVEEKRAELINGIESYQSITEFLLSLKDSPLEWEVSEVHSLGKTRLPPLDFLLVKIHDYTHLDYDGYLVVEFFNNRLAYTYFYPRDINGYVEALSRQGIIINNDLESKTSEYAKLQVEGIGSIEAHIKWFDMRLDDEVLLWHIRDSD